MSRTVLIVVLTISAQACDVQNFDLSITSNIYPSSSQVFSEKEDLCFVVSKIGRICKVAFPVTNPSL